MRRLRSLAVASLLTMAIGSGLVAAHQQRYLTTLSMVNLVVNAGLNVILIPHFGAVGCGIALIVTVRFARDKNMNELDSAQLARLIDSRLK